MDKKVFESAMQKCALAEIGALGQKYGKYRKKGETPYSAFVKECFQNPKYTERVWQNLKKVSDVVTEDEFAQLLRFPEFSRGWNFAQHYLFEERYGLNQAVHAEMEEKEHRLPSSNSFAGCEVPTMVTISRLSEDFRLIEIKIRPLYTHWDGNFILELTDRCCIVLALDRFMPPTHCRSVFRYGSLSPLRFKKLETATKNVREAIMQRYFPHLPVYTGTDPSIEEWYKCLLAEMPEDTGIVPAVCSKEQKCLIVRDFLRKTCKIEKLCSRKTWRAFKKTFDIGKIIRQLDSNINSGEVAGYKWSEGIMFRTIWFELPYDIEIPLFRKNGALYILRTVPDLKKIV